MEDERNTGIYRSVKNSFTRFPPTWNDNVENLLTMNGMCFSARAQ